MLSLDDLIVTINKEHISDRVAHIEDMARACQASSKDITKHIKALLRSQGLKAPAATAEDFLAAHGKGI